jgi:hypothetical protein
VQGNELEAVMEIERARELWGEFCFHLDETINIDIKENFYELRVFNVLEKLDWWESKGEILRKPPIKFGTTEGKPDFVLKDNINNCAVVVEVKRPNLSLTKHREQLTSYMMRLKAILGLLIGKEIEVYYDGPLYPEHDPIKVATIPFDRKSENGQILMHILDKNNFVELKSDSYLQQWIEKYKKDIKIDGLKQQLKLDTTKHKVIAFLKKEFEAYGTDILNEVLQKTEIRIISSEVHESIEPPKRPLFPWINSETAKSHPHSARQSIYLYVNVGEGPHRNWDDNMRYGYIGAGQGPQWSRQLKKLKPGDEIFTYLKGKGYVGYGVVVESACMVKDFFVDSEGKTLLELPLTAPNVSEHQDEPEICEWAVKVDWKKVFPRQQAKNFTGSFKSQHVVCKLSNQPETVNFLREQFEIGE